MTKSIEKLTQERSSPPEFQELIADEERLQELLEGSHVSTESWNKEIAWQEWEQRRRFIAGAIHKDGSILDYGSANGFLLKCFQEWSSHKLEVYGIDIDKSAIEKAKQLFPSKENHFIKPEELKNNPEFPNSFDVIYWNVWNNYTFEEKGQEKLLKRLLEATNDDGRLILGFYNEKEENKKIIQRIEHLGYKFSGIQENPNGGNEIIAWFDKVI